MGRVRDRCKGPLRNVYCIEATDIVDNTGAGPPFDAMIGVSLSELHWECQLGYYAAPVVSQLLFDRGPVSGGTSVAVSGSSFRGGSVFRCRFGAQEVNATYNGYHDQLHCVTPPAGAGGVAVEVSLNGQQFTTSGVVFEYYALVNVSHLVPSAGPRQVW